MCNMSWWRVLFLRRMPLYSPFLTNADITATSLSTVSQNSQGISAAYNPYGTVTSAIHLTPQTPPYLFPSILEIERETGQLSGRPHRGRRPSISSQLGCPTVISPLMLSIPSIPPPLLRPSLPNPPPRNSRPSITTAPSPHSSMLPTT